jgi:hypothetical protein
VILLRQALFDARGKDKDVSNGIAPAFMKYDRNGVNLEIEFTAKLTEEQVDWAFEMARVNMESIYDASGYGWDDDDKLMELTEPGSRFLLVRKKRLNFDDRPGELVGFVHFRFTIQGITFETLDCPLSGCISMRRLTSIQLLKQDIQFGLFRRKMRGLTLFVSAALNLIK